MLGTVRPKGGGDGVRRGRQNSNVLTPASGSVQSGRASPDSALNLRDEMCVALAYESGTRCKRPCQWRPSHCSATREQVA